MTQYFDRVRLTLEDGVLFMPDSLLMNFEFSQSGSFMFDIKVTYALPLVSGFSPTEKPPQKITKLYVHPCAHNKDVLFSGLQTCFEYLVLNGQHFHRFKKPDEIYPDIYCVTYNYSYNKDAF